MKKYQSKLQYKYIKMASKNTLYLHNKIIKYMIFYYLFK